MDRACSQMVCLETRNRQEPKPKFPGPHDYRGSGKILDVAGKREGPSEELRGPAVPR